MMYKNSSHQHWRLTLVTDATILDSGDSPFVSEITKFFPKSQNTCL